MNTQTRSAARILLADDDPASLLLLEELLAGPGVSFERAEDANTARALLQEEAFDLLISDINMPGNTELEFVSDLPQMANGLPVILVTAEPNLSTAVKSVRLSVVAYLTKPPQREELRSLAERAIENYRAYLALQANRKRVQNWVQDLEEIESVMRHSPAIAMPEAVRTLLSVNLRNLLGSILEVKQLADLLAHQGDPTEISKKFESARPLLLVEAIRETIQVLETTKSSFKSKELGALRRRLDALITGEPTPPRPAQ